MSTARAKRWDRAAAGTAQRGPPTYPSRRWTTGGGATKFAAEWDATIDRVVKRLREQPFDDMGNFKRCCCNTDSGPTDENKETVLAMLAKRATFGAAAAAVGAQRRTIMKWRDNDEQFVQRWSEAVEEGIDRLAAEAIPGRATASSDPSSTWVSWCVTFRNEATVCSSSCWRPNGQRSIGRAASM